MVIETSFIRQHKDITKVEYICEYFKAIFHAACDWYETWIVLKIVGKGYGV